MKASVKFLPGLAAALAALAAGCIAPRPDGGHGAGSKSAALGGMDLSAFGLPEKGADAPLYAHDGGVVSAPAPGSVTQQGSVPSALGRSPDSRLSILELYQRAVNEREALAGEVDHLRAALERAETELAATLAGSKEHERNAAALGEAKTRLESENADLAGRLVTAQIRRLEAERELLELKLARQAEEAAAGPGALLPLAPAAGKHP